MNTPEETERTLPDWFIEEQRERGRKGGKNSWASRGEEGQREFIAYLTVRRVAAFRKRREQKLLDKAQ